MTLRSLVSILRDRWLLLVIAFVVFVGGATLITALTAKVYQAHVQVLVASNGSSDPLSQYQAAAFAQSQVATYASVIDSPDVLDRVRKSLSSGLDDNTLKSKISATAPTDRTLVDIYATDGSPRQAANIANAAARAFQTVIQTYSISTTTGKSAVRLFITNPASVPSSAITPNVPLNLVIGIVLALLFGIAGAVTREALDTRIKNIDSLSKAAGAPVMGAIIEDSLTSRHPIAGRAGRRSIRGENFRQLRANLQFANVDEHPRLIAITSSVPGEGKTAVAMNLASTLAETGFTVCLVDADLRRPTVARVLGLPGAVGLTNVLVRQIELDEALQSGGRNLQILVAGQTPPNPSEVLASSYVRDVVRSLLDRFDYVVVDTAPLLPVADGAEVAALADGTLLVARYNETTETQVKRAVSSLRRVDANVIGVLLNRIPSKRSREYGYGYYHSEEPRPKRDAPRPGTGSPRPQTTQNALTGQQ